MFEQVEEARAGKGGKVLSEKEISKVLDDHRNRNLQHVSESYCQRAASRRHEAVRQQPIKTVHDSSSI